MKINAACLLVLAMVSGLSACGGRESSDQFANCKSLAPLLKALPEAKAVEGVAETVRECDPTNALVKVIYGGGNDAVQYAYSLDVIDGESPYVEGLLGNPENMQGGEDSFIEVLDALAAARRRHFDACVENDMPTRNIDGREFCVDSDDDYRIQLEDGSRGVSWHARALDGDLALHVSMWGKDASNLGDAESALDYLDPFIRKINFDALRANSGR